MADWYEYADIVSFYDAFFNPVVKEIE